MQSLQEIQDCSSHAQSAYENNQNYLSQAEFKYPNSQFSLAQDQHKPQQWKPKLLKDVNSELDPKLELLFNRVDFFQEQVDKYQCQSTSLKDQMFDEIERNKKVEETVGEQIIQINENLNDMTDVVESVAEKKSFLEQVISQIKLVKLIQMENEFLKRDNKQLKTKIDDLYTVITDFQQNEEELLISQDNLKQDLNSIIQENRSIKNIYSDKQESKASLEYKYFILQQKHNKLLADYQTAEKENKLFKQKDKELSLEKGNPSQRSSYSQVISSIQRNESISDKGFKDGLSNITLSQKRSSQNNNYFNESQVIFDSNEIQDKFKEQKQ